MTNSEIKSAATRQAPVGAFREHLARLGEALQRGGVKPGQAVETLSTGLKASCLECGLSLSPEEIAGVLDSTAPASPKVERIRLGYCGRNTCRSSFYEISPLFPDDPAWARAWAETGDETAAGVVTEEKGGSTRPGMLEVMVQAYGRKKIAVAAGLALLAVLMVYSRLRSPSWASKPSEFKPAPVSATNIFFNPVPPSLPPPF